MNMKYIALLACLISLTSMQAKPGCFAAYQPDNYVTCSCRCRNTYGSFNHCIDCGHASIPCAMNVPAEPAEQTSSNSRYYVKMAKKSAFSQFNRYIARRS